MKGTLAVVATPAGFSFLHARGERGIGCPLPQPLLPPAHTYDRYLAAGGLRPVPSRPDTPPGRSVTLPAAEVAVAEREFLGYAVEEMVESGIRQFLDLGSGLPTRGHVHQVAQGLNRSARVVYVDSDPWAVMQARTILDGRAGVAVVHGDVRDPAAVLSAPDVRDLIDLAEPVGLLAVGVLHYVTGDAASLLARFRDALPGGSALALTHVTGEGELLRRGAQRLVAGLGGGHPRCPHQVEALFTGWELRPPGLARVEHFPDPHVPVREGEPPVLWLAGGLAFLRRSSPPG